MLTLKKNQPYKNASYRGRNAYSLHAPMNLEQRILAEAGRQIETIAFALAGRIPANQVAELIELAAKAQSLKINPEV